MKNANNTFCKTTYLTIHMKKTFYLCILVLLACTASAANLAGKRIYVNPGHGSWGPNDRPMATIPYPSSLPDTMGFYESNTNLWKGMKLGEKLKEYGATVVYSRTQSGPWPYCKDCADAEKYNRNLAEICEEVEAGNFDYFLSIHSDAATDGALTNNPLFLYRGRDGGQCEVKNSYEMAQTMWPYLITCMESGIDPSSRTSPNLRGDWDFYGSYTTSTRSNGKKYTGYLGVLKHGCPGFLSEGYHHTYQPARHRALNPDYCGQEGIRFLRGILKWFGADEEKVGYIMGTVKDAETTMDGQVYFTYRPNTNDQWLPCNGAVVSLYKGGKKVDEYIVDSKYNGIFIFENLEPGDDYTIDITCTAYEPLADEYKQPVSVKANETTYLMTFLKKAAPITTAMDLVWEQNAAALPASKGGMFVMDGNIYLQDAAAGELYQYKLADGSFVGKVPSVKGAYAVAKDDAGHVFFFNDLGETDGVQPMLYDLNEHKITKTYDIIPVGAYVEYPSIYGDMLNGTAYIYAAPYKTAELMQTTFVNGTKTTQTSFSVDTKAVGPNFVVPIDKTHVLVYLAKYRVLYLELGSNICFTAYNEGRVRNISAGGDFFTMSGENFCIFPYTGSTIHKGGFRVYNICDPHNMDVSQARTTDIAEGDNLAETAVFIEAVPVNNGVFIVDYAPGIGLACHHFYDVNATSAVDDIKAEDNAENGWKKVMINGHIFLMYENTIYDLQGRLVK